MRVALVHYAYPPAIGGVETLIRRHARLLADAGLDVSVFAGAGEETYPGVHFTLVPDFHSLKNIDAALDERVRSQQSYDTDFYALSARIEAQLEQHLAGMDALIVHNMLALHRNLPLLHAFRQYAARHPQQRIISWVHDHAFFWYGRNRKDELGLSKEAESWLADPIPGVKYVAISGTFAKALGAIMNLPAEAIKVIPNGIDVADFLAMEQPFWKLLKEHGLLRRYPLILAPVNLIERKNLEYSIEIVHHLRETYPKAALFITGKPSQHRDTVDYRTKLQDLIEKHGLKDHIYFLGEWMTEGLTESQVRSLYNLSDAVFYFSGHENFGLPLLEAFFARVPLFASDIPVFQEVTQGLVSLVSVEHQSAQETARQVATYLEQEQDGKRYHLVRTQFDLEMIVERDLIPLLKGS